MTEPRYQCEIYKFKSQAECSRGLPLIWIELPVHYFNLRQIRQWKLPSLRSQIHRARKELPPSHRDCVWEASIWSSMNWPLRTYRVESQPPLLISYGINLMLHSVVQEHEKDNVVEIGCGSAKFEPFSPSTKSSNTSHYKTLLLTMFQIGNIKDRLCNSNHTIPSVVTEDPPQNNLKPKVIYQHFKGLLLSTE